MNLHHGYRTLCLGLVLAVPLTAGAKEPAAYDPLNVAKKPAVKTVDFTVNDESRHREIPIRVYLPAETEPQPVIVFSHGLGGSREGYSHYGRHWAARGYVVVFVQHPGSDTSVWKDKPRDERMSAMRQAASAQNLVLRVKDVPAVITQLEKWNRSGSEGLAGRLDLKHIGMAGHSFGAVTTQAVAGQTAVGGRLSFTDPRISAAIAMSPSLPRRGDAQQAFAGVKIPWMLMTGTKDDSPIGDSDARSRLGVFPALPAGNKYELVLDGAEHSVFSERALPGDREPRKPQHHRAILALSTAFWDAYLRADTAAQAWLDGDEPREVLDKADRWQRK